MHAGTRITPAKALGLLAVVVIVVAGFLGLMAVVGNHEAWAGFLFLLYWSMVEGMKTDALAKSLRRRFCQCGIAAPRRAAPASCAAMRLPSRLRGGTTLPPCGRCHGAWHPCAG